MTTTNNIEAQKPKKEKPLKKTRENLEEIYANNTAINGVSPGRSCGNHAARVWRATREAEWEHPEPGPGPRS